MQTISVKIPDDLNAELEALAAENERSKSYYIRRAIANLLEDLEDIKIAKERLAEIEKGEPTYSLEEVMRELGLEQ